MALTFQSTASAQVWTSPYTAGSSADLALRFSNGANGNATSPNIPFALGLSFNDTTPGIGTGGGWGLSATGTAAVGVGIVIAGETHTRTNVAAGTLAFQMQSSGINQIVGLSMGSKWYANVTVPGSGSWTAPTDQFRYTFDAALSSDLITLSPGFFSNYTLTIQSNSTILYQGTLASILPTLTPVVTGASVQFDYDPSQGPLEIIWSGNGTVNSSLLNILGDGTTNIFSISNGAVQYNAIPEPGTVALLVASCGAMTLFHRRRRS